jgi:isopentenyl-diphosphate delta-isomerase
MKKRKDEHIDICLDKNIEYGDNGLSQYKFIHNALPEIDFNEIDTSIEFLNKKISAPIIIAPMTCGSSYKQININLAKAAENKNIPLSIGSERILLENNTYSLNIRKYCKNIPLIGNLGAVQLNYGFSLKQCKKAIDLVQADALALHLNPLQEALQKEGQSNFKNLLKKIQKINQELDYPLIIKEVGCGISKQVGLKLKKINIKYIDVAGHGGTNFALIESMRKDKKDTVFKEWGISTTESILLNKKLGINIIASGGIRNGLQVAKAIALGADYCSVGLPFLKQAIVSNFEVEKGIEKIINELKIAMFCIGVKNINQLKNNKALIKK